MPQHHPVRTVSADERSRLLSSQAGRLAWRECRPKSESSFYPGELSDVAEVLAHSKRMPTDGPGLNRARSLMASGIPYQELTRRDGTTRTPQLQATS